MSWRKSGRPPNNDCLDFVLLARLLGARDFQNETLTKKDRQRIRAMVQAARGDRRLLLEIPGAEQAIERLALAARIVG